MKILNICKILNTFIICYFLLYFFFYNKLTNCMQGFEFFFNYFSSSLIQRGLRVRAYLSMILRNVFSLKNVFFLNKKLAI